VYVPDAKDEVIGVAGIPAFFMGKRENAGSESEAPTVRGYIHPLSLEQTSLLLKHTRQPIKWQDSILTV